jgi:hypothetical protein
LLRSINVCTDIFYSQVTRKGVYGPASADKNPDNPEIESGFGYFCRSIAYISLISPADANFIINMPKSIDNDNAD